MWHRGFSTKREAQKYLNELLHKIEIGTYVAPSKITLADFLKQWLNDYAKVNTAPKTYQGYERIIRQHLIPKLGNMKMDQLKPIHIQQYYTNRLTEGRIDGSGGLSNRSVLHHHRLLHKALEDAVKWQIIAINPAKAVNSPKDQKKKVNVLTKEQVHALLQYVKSHKYYAPIYLAIKTGMRRGEILGIRWEDVDFEKYTISVNQQIQRLKKQGVVFKPTTKNNGSRRTIAISESVASVLKRQINIRKRDRLKFGILYHDHQLIFANEDGSPIDPDAISREFPRIIRRIEDFPKVRFHDLRHTHATLLLQQGEHPKIVSERLGHATISMTMDTYSHVMPNMQKAAAKKFDDFLFGNENDEKSDQKKQIN